MPSITQSPEWIALERDKEALKQTSMREIFAADPTRFSR